MSTWKVCLIWKNKKLVVEKRDMTHGYVCRRICVTALVVCDVG